MFATLLQTYNSDLSKLVQDQHQSLMANASSSLLSRLTSLARSVLPSLRLSSMWLLTNSQILVAGIGDQHLKAAINDFWVLYTDCLSRAAAIFPVQELPECSYQLEEDVDAIGFKPLECERTQKTWLDATTSERKSKYNDNGLHRLSPDLEMLARIRELMIDGLLLAVDEVRIGLFKLLEVTNDRSLSTSRSPSMARSSIMRRKLTTQILRLWRNTILRRKM